jgi:hypothetical protein
MKQNLSLTWGYYLREGGTGANGYTIWNAPAAINDICVTSGPNRSCQGSDYQKKVQPHLPYCPSDGSGDCAPILTDIQNCNLPSVSWVIPDGNWSDHAGGPTNEKGDGGPSWVANIFNAVGGYGPPANGCGYWNNTVILVVWDDWGGYYDDVVPPDCPGPGQCSGYSNKTGQQYVYGFRVPLLVIGAYTNNFPGGYISGPPSNPNCGQPGSYWCHDFGSILNFIEYAFGLPQGGISSSNLDPYADALAMDAPPTCTACTYSLSDFFTFSPSNFHAFQPIIPLEYGPSCFHNPYGTGCFHDTYPQDPDNDANETD